MSRERELEKFVKGAFFDGFLIGYDTGANDGALDSEEEKKRAGKNRPLWSRAVLEDPVYAQTSRIQTVDGSVFQGSL